MINRILSTLALVCLLPLLTLSHARAATTKPAAGPSTRPAGFEKEIEAFEAADAKKAPPQGAVLFLGSSSIRKWTTLADDFPGIQVINRGFGGSTIPDSTKYASRIVIPYKPRIIVFYAGDNDIAAGHKPERVLSDFKTFVATVRPALPKTRILFIAIKPSPSRVKLLDQGTKANRLIREYIATDPTLGYVDIVTPMLDGEGKPRAELFLADRLHMNHKGYALWTSIITPLLKQEPDRPAGK